MHFERWSEVQKPKKLTRAQILKGIGYKALKDPRVPAPVLETENRATEDYLVAWAQGLAAHVDKVEAAAQKPKQMEPQKKGRGRRSPAR